MTDNKNMQNILDNQPNPHCQRCGSPITSKDLYCKKCGTPTPFKSELESQGYKDPASSASLHSSEQRVIRKTAPRTLRKRIGSERNSSESALNLSDTQRLRFNFDEEAFERKESSQKQAKTPKAKPERIEYALKTKNRRSKSDVPVFWGVRIFVFLILSLIIGGAYGIFKVVEYAQANADNAVETVQAFEQAMNDDSGETLAQLFSSEKDIIAVTELAPFIEKTRVDTAYKDALVQALKRDAEAIDAGQRPAQSGEIQIIPQGESKFGIQQYGLTISKMDINYTLPEGMDLIISGNVINSDTQNGTFSLYPGLYKIGLQYEELTLHYSLDVSSANPQAQNNVISFNYENLRLQDSLSDLEVSSGDRRLEIRTLGNSDALVFINNRNSGLSVDDFNDLEKTSVKTGDQVRIVVKEDWGFVASPNHTLGPESWVRLHVNYQN